MQALIDFDGWRKWKDFSSNDNAEKTKALTKSPALDGVSKADLAAKAKDKRAKRENQRTSLDGAVSASKKDESQPPTTAGNG